MADLEKVLATLDKLESDQRRDEFVAYAEKKGVRYAVAAAKLADYDGTNLAGALERVLEAHPYLNAEKRQPKIIGAGTGYEDAEFLATRLDSYKLEEAHAKAKAGSIKDRVAYAQLKREMEKE